MIPSSSRRPCIRKAESRAIYQADLLKWNLPFKTSQAIGIYITVWEALLQWMATEDEIPNTAGMQLGRDYQPSFILLISIEKQFCFVFFLRQNLVFSKWVIFNFGQNSMNKGVKEGEMIRERVNLAGGSSAWPDPLALVFNYHFYSSFP